MITTAIMLLVLVIAYVLYLEYYKTKVADDLDIILANGATILDVRTKTEYKKGHIKEAINIPIGSLNTVDIPIEKNQPIITYCSHGIRSYKAVEILKNKGYSTIYNGGAMKHLKKFIV